MPAGTNLPTGATNTAFLVYRVGDSEESGMVFLSTANWDATAPTTIPTANAKPYGNKGVVIMRKGGDGQIIQTRFLTNVDTLGIPGGVNSAKLN